LRCSTMGCCGSKPNPATGSPGTENAKKSGCCGPAKPAGGAPGFVPYDKRKCQNVLCCCLFLLFCEFARRRAHP
jgi:hypothetical protein